MIPNSAAELIDMYAVPSVNTFGLYMCNQLHSSYVNISTAVIWHQVLKEKALQQQCSVEQANACCEMQTDKM